MLPTTCDYNSVCWASYICILYLFVTVYDTSSRETFEKLEEWLNEVEMYSTKKDIVKMLVGNKIDKVRNFNTFLQMISINGMYCASTVS